MTIAFLDHHLDNWHAKVFLGLLRERGHDVVAYESDPKEGDWCADHNVTRVGSPDEALEIADAVMVLAPDNIDAHLDLTFAVLAAGKPVWVDKQLAPTLDHSLRIVRMAEYHGTPLTCASSLSHAAELEEALEAINGRVEEGVFSGYGEWHRYGVHTIAMALRAIPSRVETIDCRFTPHVKQVELGFEDGRCAFLTVVAGKNSSAAFPWRFALRSGEEYVHGTVTRFDEFYERECEAILRAFETRETMRHDEMLDTVRILENVAAVSS
ncbi:hypothetical protein EON82_05765 [bacterium]|nr:MAG: hypothetical protein EON82_05765 [bacterium]